VKVVSTPRPLIILFTRSNNSFRVPAILRETSEGTSYQTFRLVFRPYTHVRRTICTSVSLRASTRVSSGFALRGHSSTSFGSRGARSRSDPSGRASGSADGAAPAVRPRRFPPERAEPAFAFIARRGLRLPDARARPGLLGPCFKTGRSGPFRRRPGPARWTARPGGARAALGRCSEPPTAVAPGSCRGPPPPPEEGGGRGSLSLGRGGGGRPSALFPASAGPPTPRPPAADLGRPTSTGPRAEADVPTGIDRREGGDRSRRPPALVSSRRRPGAGAATLPEVRRWPRSFPFRRFQALLTLFSKFFSSFDRSTCSLSVSCRCLALDRTYDPLEAAFPNNPTLGTSDVGGRLPGRPRGCHPLRRPVPGNSCPADAADGRPRGYNSGDPEAAGLRT